MPPKHPQKLTLLIFLSIFTLIPSANAAQSAEIFLQLGHSSDVLSVSYSPDGKFIASGSSDNTVKVWEAETGNLIRTLSGHSSGVLSVRYSLDGKFIASGSGDKTVKVWETETGNLIRTLSGHLNRVWSVSYSPDGKFIASGSGDNTVKVWEAETGNLIRTLSGHSSDVLSAGYSPDGKFIASGSDDKTVMVWEAETGNLVRTLSGHSSIVFSVSYSFDGKFIASGSGDKTVKVWEAETGNLIRTLSRHSSLVWSVSYSPDGKFIASGSGDKTMKVWEAETGNLVRTLSGHSSIVFSVSYSFDGKFIASGSGDKTVKAWEAETGNLIRTLNGHLYIVNSVSYSPDGKFIASGSDDKTVMVWEAETGNLIRTLSGHSYIVNSVGYSPDGKFIASGSDDKTVMVWETETGNLIRTLSGHSDTVRSVSYSPDGKFIASGSDDKMVMVWEAETGNIVRILDGHSFIVMSVSYSPDGKFIASGSDDKTVMVWEAETGNLIHILRGHSYVWSVSYSPDGKFIAFGSDDKTVMVWEAETGKLIRTLSGHSDSVRSVSYSPDGKFIASGSYDNTVKVWEAESGKLIRTLSGHSDSVRSVSCSPDGKFIASGSYDNTVKVWDIHNANQRMTIAFLPGNEWLTWQHKKLLYNSSLQGDEYAAIRFDNRSTPVYPLEYYRKELKRPDWIHALPYISPEIKPRDLRLWWDTTSKQTIQKIATITSTILASILILCVAIIRMRSGPLEISKRFFAKAGFQKAVPLPGNILHLHAKKKHSGGLVSVWQENDTNLQEFQNLEGFINKGTKLYLVYNEQQPPAKLMQDLREQTRTEVISIQSSRMKKALYNETCHETLKELEEPFVTRTDPYTESKPIKDITWFYGRDSLMNRLPPVLAQGQHVGIFGLRKVGKTSLIRQIQQRFAETPTVLADCQTFSSQAEIYFEEILRQIHTELRAHEIKKLPELKPLANPEDFHTQFLTLFDLWKKSGRHEPFIIILDEIDKFFPDREIKENRTTLAEYVRFFKVLRGLAQTHHCLVTMVAAYRPDVNRHNLLTPGLGENPMFRSFQEEYLGFLSHTDSTRMIQEIGMWKNIKWEDNAAQRVYYYCGGHPLVTRYFASEACNEGSLKHVDYEQVENTAMEILNSFHLNDIGNYYKEGIWAYLNEKERSVVSLICRKQQENISAADIPKQLKEPLANLQHFGLVENEKGTLCLTANLFYEWLKQEV